MCVVNYNFKQIKEKIMLNKRKNILKGTEKEIEKIINYLS